MKSYKLKTNANNDSEKDFEFSLLIKNETEQKMPLKKSGVNDEELRPLQGVRPILQNPIGMGGVISSTKSQALLDGGSAEMNEKDSNIPEPMQEGEQLRKLEENVNDALKLNPRDGSCFGGWIPADTKLTIKRSETIDRDDFVTFDDDEEMDVQKPGRKSGSIDSFLMLPLMSRERLFLHINGTMIHKFKERMEVSANCPERRIFALFAFLHFNKH